MAIDPSAAFLSTLVDDLAAAIEAVAGSTVAVAEGSGVPDHGWTFSLTVTGSFRGTARVTLDDVGVTTLLQLVLGPEADTGEGAARDLLSELMNQALGTLRAQPSFADLTIALAPLERSAPLAEQATCFSLVLGDGALQLAAGATLESEGTHPDASERTAKSAPPSTTPATTPRRGEASAPSTDSALPKNLDVVLDIELPLSVRFGSTLMSVRALSTLGPGSIVDMGRSPDDPVEILVCGRPIARAEVVIVGGNYAVRITDLTSAAERIRAMEGQL